MDEVIVGNTLIIITLLTYVLQAYLRTYVDVCRCIFFATICTKVHAHVLCIKLIC